MARIAIVCEPPDGGVAEHVFHLVRGLPAHGHEAVLFAPAEFKYAAELPMRVLPFRRDYAHPHEDARSLGRLYRALDGFDLVHSHSAKSGVIGRVAAKLAAAARACTRRTGSRSWGRCRRRGGNSAW